MLRRRLLSAVAGLALLAPIGAARALAALGVVVALLAPPGARADEGIVVENAGARAFIDDDEVILSTPGFSRHWHRDPMWTFTAPGFNSPGPDFSLTLDGATFTSAAFQTDDVTAEPIPGGIRLTWDLSLPSTIAAGYPRRGDIPGILRVVRTVEAYGDVAGFATQMELHPLVPLALGGYTLDEIPAWFRPGAPTIHAFRAGADWRYDDGFDPVGIGDDHLGHWRESRSAGEGEDLIANGEWLSVRFPTSAVPDPGHFTLGMIMERRNMASSVAEYSFTDPYSKPPAMRIGVDFSRDIVYGGPFEESIHAENPREPAPPYAEAQGIARVSEPGARARPLVPGRPLTLERVLTVNARDEDHQAWEYSKYLTRHRMTPYPKAVTFNTNGVDHNAISTGAKDDVDFARLQTLAAAAREMGVETFILDDGWQARSGDWCPDSPQCPEPRWDGVDIRFAPRFPDDEFRAVREVLAGDPDDPSDDMALGLWMTPMEFHPASAAYQRSPVWACAPVGHATAAPSFADGGGSFDAGIGVWNPRALGLHPDTGEPLRLSRYIEDRIRRAIDVYGARYFKFDFLAWVDCAGVEPVDMYDYHDEFVAMLDRLQETYPNVTFSIDETNDYRMFPFESVARGPSWFQNGKPRTEQLLHNVWNLAPFVPGWSLGQHAASGDAERRDKGVDAVMAASLTSHITFWNEIDAAVTPAERVQIRLWTDFYKQHRDTLAGFTIPLLEDPLEKGWTALQPWDLDEQRGWLLAYRQEATGDTATIPLRALDPDATYALTQHDPGTGTSTSLGTMAGGQLLEGLDVTIAAQYGYALIQIEAV